MQITDTRNEAVAPTCPGSARSQFLILSGPSPRPNSFAWQIDPNPGGIPAIGSTTFGVTVEVAPGTPNASAVWLSLGAGNLTALGLTLLVDVRPGFLASVPITPAPAASLPLPLTANLAGITLYAQSVHLDSGGVLATSEGCVSTLSRRSGPRGSEPGARPPPAHSCSRKISAANRPAWIARP